MSATDLAECIEKIYDQRRSVRGYLNKQVPQCTLEKIFTLAQRTPSNCNTQPWIVHVVSGAKLDFLRDRIYQASLTASFELDYPYNQKYEGIYKERQYDAAARLYDSMSIRREDKERRNELFMRNFSCFGAPHVAFLFLPEQFGLREAADVGMYAQSLMLTLAAFGLGSCPQTSLGFHANLVRDVLQID
ncbi:MAG TPA: nitroreductase family protein, partial [Pseudomonadales bacterium]|nr:nitroreductase family protein [Pseudomonadales bacterium]